MRYEGGVTEMEPAHCFFITSVPRVSDPDKYPKDICRAIP